VFQTVETSHEEEKPAPGWACVALAVGFVAFLAAGLAAVLIIG
jgi:hypothetical protein